MGHRNVVPRCQDFGLKGDVEWSFWGVGPALSGTPVSSCSVLNAAEESFYSES